MLNQTACITMAVIFFILLIVLIILLAVFAGNNNNNNCCYKNNWQNKAESEEEKENEEDDDNNDKGRAQELPLSEGEVEEVPVQNFNGKSTKVNNPKDLKDINEATVEDPNIPLSSVLYHLVKAVGVELDPPSKSEINKDDEKGKSVEESKETQIKDILGVMEAKTPVKRLVVKGGKGEIASDFTSSS